MFFFQSKAAKFLRIFILSISLPLFSFSQNISGVINSYAAVNSINGTTLGLSTVAGFAVGDKVMIIQMQGAVINTANNATFGSIVSYNQAGLYEFNYIGSINSPSVALACPLQNSYSVTSAVQLIKVPVYAAANINGILTCQPWNGTTGGVLAFESTNLTFSSDIDVNAKGFRGGAISSGGFCCASNNFVTNTPGGGQKGESISAYTVGMDGSKGKNSGGGGGSNCGNSGGGGGALGGNGGLGGNIYNGCGAGDQGQNGNSLAATTGRMFLGSGGGGGFRDNGQSCTPGGIGGGIVFIISNQITGGGRNIFSRGADVLVNAADEGAGGGGSGGSVYMLCPTYVGLLTVDTKGGKGGSNFNTIFTGNCHGPGGGGGGGVFAYSTPVIPGGVTYTSPGGVAGLVLNPASPCYNTTWGGTAGSNGVQLNNLTVTFLTPTITVAGTPTVCLGSAVTLTANGTSSYTWNTGATTGTVSVTPLVVTTYTVTGGLYSCTNTATYSITPVPLPTVTIAGNFTVCSGSSTTLTANGATSYTWTGGPLTNTFAVAPLVTTVYTVSGSNSTCSTSANVTVTALPLPVPVLNTNSPVCLGQPINLNGLGGTVYSWTGPGGFSSGMQNPVIAVSSTASAGIYTLTVTDANNCSNTITANVIINNLPVISPVGSTVCVNQNFGLTASGGTAFAWTGPLGYNSTTQNPVIPNSTVPMTGGYTITVTDFNSCTSTSVANVVVNPLPVPIVGCNSPLCATQTLSLTAAGGLNYGWAGPGGFLSTAQNPNLVNVGILASGNYTLVATDNIGCQGIAVINVTVHPLPVGTIVSSGNKGCEPYCATFTCNTNANLQNLSWSFSDGLASGNGTNTAHCFNYTGNYVATAVVTDMNNCTILTTYSVTAFPKPVADFSYAPLKPVVNEDADVQFTDASYKANVKTWDWYFMDYSKPHSSLQNPNFVYVDAGSYVVALVVKSDHGCLDTIIKTIVVGEDYGIFVPNTFTPNGDGFNDVFQPKGFGISKFEFDIFDRWGEKVFHTNDFKEGWDGTFKKANNKVMEGTYSWRIYLTNASGKTHELAGHVILIK